MSAENPPIGITPENTVNFLRKTTNFVVIAMAAKIFAVDFHGPDKIAQMITNGNPVIHFLAKYGLGGIATTLAIPMLASEIYNSFLPNLARNEDSASLASIGRITRGVMAGGATLLAEKMVGIHFGPDRNTLLAVGVPIAISIIIGAAFLPPEISKNDQGQEQNS